jgi:hypothetical protein
LLSFQITVLKVLAGHPDGRASVAELTRYVSVLIASGPDWSDRMRSLANRAPNLDIFSDKLILREQGGWQITDIGRQFLSTLEAPIPEVQTERSSDGPATAVPKAIQPLLRIVVDNTRSSTSEVGSDEARRSA